MSRKREMRDYIVTVEFTEFGQLQWRELLIREFTVAEAKASARKAGWHSILAVRTVLA